MKISSAKQDGGLRPPNTRRRMKKYSVSYRLDEGRFFTVKEKEVEAENKGDAIQQVRGWLKENKHLTKGYYAPYDFKAEEIE